MRAPLLTLLALLLSSGLAAAQSPAAPTLDIYFIDTEGGQATLFVAPTGESVLIDAGNPGARDTDRILATLAEAGVRQIDYLLLTHYHSDHVGGVQELARRIPIVTYVDHGPTVDEREPVEGFQSAYDALHAGARRILAAPGDQLPIPGVDWRIVTAAGRVLASALPGAGAGAGNPLCADFQPKGSVAGENAASVGSVVTYGEFRTIDLGDLLWNVEYDLMCPVNRVGTVDLYITSHHGLATSGSPALVHALRPRVAVMNNGTRKGGAVETFQTIRSAPGLEDLWQLHWSHHGGVEHNSAGVFIANIDSPSTLAAVIDPPAAAAGAQPAPAPPHDGPAEAIRVSASADGSFTVTNTRTGLSKHYAAAE